MSGYIKYFENGGQNMSFVIDDVLYETWDKIKETLNIKFHSMPVHDKKYMKVKVRKFNSVIKRNLLCDEIPIESMHYTCIACITIDSVMRIEKIIIHKFIYSLSTSVNTNKKNKKIKIINFINTELESESELESNTELESKSELDSDSESSFSTLYCLCFKQILACFLEVLLVNLKQVKKLIAILLTFGKPAISLLCTSQKLSSYFANFGQVKKNK